MRRLALLPVLLCAGLLCACVAPALLLPSSTDLMLALLKPLVGIDPKAVNLFENPMIKQRMSALLGARYNTALTLLRTADQLQREGPLFFVVSRYTPFPELADRAGLVWNANTNQMAAAIVHGEAVEVFSEWVGRRSAAVVEGSIAAARDAAVETAVASVTPAWPAPMQAWFPAADVAPPATDVAPAPAVP